MGSWTKEDWEAYRALNQLEVNFRGRKPTDGQLILFRKFTNASPYLPGKWDQKSGGVRPINDDDSLLPLIHTSSLKGWISIEGWIQYPKESNVEP